MPCVTLVILSVTCPHFRCFGPFAHTTQMLKNTELLPKLVPSWRHGCAPCWNHSSHNSRPPSLSAGPAICPHGASLASNTNVTYHALGKGEPSQRQGVCRVHPCGPTQTHTDTRLRWERSREPVLKRTTVVPGNKSHLATATSLETRGSRGEEQRGSGSDLCADVPESDQQPRSFWKDDCQRPGQCSHGKKSENRHSARAPGDTDGQEAIQTVREVVPGQAVMLWCPAWALESLPPQVWRGPERQLGRWAGLCHLGGWEGLETAGGLPWLWAQGAFRSPHGQTLRGAKDTGLVQQDVALGGK